MNLFEICALLSVFVLAETDESVCEDKRPDCEYFVDFCDMLGESKTKESVRSSCRKTCGLCDDKPKLPVPSLPPHEGGCGTPDFQGIRVIAGKTPVRGSWPWQVLLMFMRDPMCGGTLVSPNWVITAAHCVYEKDQYAELFQVRVGEHDTRVIEGSERDVTVEKIIIHPAWSADTINNDIAMMKLSEPIKFNKFVSPACLPSADPPVGAKCYLTGWGKTKHPGSMTSLLQQGQLPVVSNEVCYEKNKHSISVPITESMICGGSGGSSRLTGCHGDSGGPYVCEINGRWELHGSVSHGSANCESTESYTVFSRTHFFKPWILKQMENN